MGASVVRRAVAEDWEAVRSIRLRALRRSPEAFASTYDREAASGEGAWRRRVAERTWFLAWQGGTPVGLVAGAPEPDRSTDWHLVSMWVAEDLRGTGTATRLVEALCGEAVRAGATTVSLWVADGNERARRFYERLGFRPTGERQPLPSDPAVGEDRLVRELEPSPLPRRPAGGAPVHGPWSGGAVGGSLGDPRGDLGA